MLMIKKIPSITDITSGLFINAITVVPNITAPAYNAGIKINAKAIANIPLNNFFTLTPPFIIYLI